MKENKLWPLNWLILDSKCCTGTFSSESVRFLFELIVVQSFVNTAVKWKKGIWAQFPKGYLTSPTELHWDFQTGQVCVIWPCIRYTEKKKRKKWNNVKSKLQLEGFPAMAEMKCCQESKKHAWTIYISTKFTIYHFLMSSCLKCQLHSREEIIKIERNWSICHISALSLIYRMRYFPFASDFVILVRTNSSPAPMWDKPCCIFLFKDGMAVEHSLALRSGTEDEDTRGLLLPLNSMLIWNRASTFWLQALSGVLFHLESMACLVCAPVTQKG